MGDLNVKVGSDNSSCEVAMGKHGCGSINDHGERLVDFCMKNCIIGGTVLPQKKIHKLTWKSLDGRTVNQKDHEYVIINKKWRKLLLDVKVHRGTDVSSDRCISFAKVKLKLMAVDANKQCRKVYDINRLKSQEVRSSFNIEFGLLQNI